MTAPQRKIGKYDRMFSGFFLRYQEIRVIVVDEKGVVRAPVQFLREDGDQTMKTDKTPKNSLQGSPNVYRICRTKM